VARRECCRSPAPGDTYTELFSDMGSTPIASTNRNAVEPAESGVKSLGSAGFLFVEKGAEGYS